MGSSHLPQPSAPQPEMETIRVSEDAVELAGSLTGSVRTRSRSPPPPVMLKNGGLLANLGLGGVARRTIGMCLLLLVVFLWTLSNFLASVRKHGKEPSVPNLMSFSSSSFPTIPTTNPSSSSTSTHPCLPFLCYPCLSGTCRNEVCRACTETYYKCGKNTRTDILKQSSTK